jgi:putative transcription factor
MADQDWDSVTRIGSKARGGAGGGDHVKVIKGKSAINAAARSGAILGTEKKYAPANTVSFFTNHLHTAEANIRPLEAICRRTAPDQSRPLRRDRETQDGRPGSRASYREASQ